VITLPALFTVTLRTLALVVATTVLCPVSALAQQPAAGSAGGAQVETLPAQPDRPDVQVRTWLSRTAIWVGDPVEFVVELTCAPTIDILTDDLAREKLRVEGLDVLDATSEREVHRDGSVTQRVRYRLTTFDIGSTDLRIGGTTVRYYARRPGQRPQDTALIGEVQIPGATVAWRSTLPDALANLNTRDAGALRRMPRVLALARPVAIGLLLLSAGPVAVWGAGRMRRQRSRARRPSERAVRSHTQAAFDELRAVDLATDSGRREAYGRLEKALRRHVADTRGIPAHAWIARDFAAALQSSGGSDERLAELLVECEQARYGPPDRLPSAERFAATLAAAAQVIGGIAT
jgi:hypothetical protein